MKEKVYQLLSLIAIVILALVIPYTCAFGKTLEKPDRMVPSKMVITAIERVL